MKRELKTDNVRVVTKNSFITADGLPKLSRNARKMLYLIISQCRKNDAEFYDYEISLEEFSKITGIAQNDLYRKKKIQAAALSEADRIQAELMPLVIVIRDGEDTGRYTVFSSARYNKSRFYMKLNPDMTKLLLNITGSFTQPLLSDFMRMRSKYGAPIWHLMQREMHSAKPTPQGKKKFKLSLAELRHETDTEESLTKISSFEHSCLDIAIKDIETNCAVNVEYEPYFKGRRVDGFIFTVTDAVYVQPFTEEEKERYSRNFQEKHG